MTHGRFAIVVHGGAGAIASERHAIVRASVERGARAGRAVLVSGGSALDAVGAAVRVLEDDPELNAGTGSVLTRDGTVETDACVMCGDTRRVGAVGAVPDLGCAVAVARAVLERGEHVLLAGTAALDFAREVGIAAAAPGALVTPRQRERLAAWLAAQASAGSQLGSEAGSMSGSGPASGSGLGSEAGSGPGSGSASGSEGGTVGAVARDRAGRFAAATSTGGMVGKRRGRVGDSPIPGAGTWADRAVAVSATGDGEAVLRVALARTIAMHCAHSGDLDRAVRAALAELRAITGGSAGVIAIGAGARVALQLSPAMPIAWSEEGDAPEVWSSLGAVAM